MNSDSERDDLPYREHNPFDEFDRMDVGDERFPVRISEKTVVKPKTKAKPRAKKEARSS